MKQLFLLCKILFYFLPYHRTLSFCQKVIHPILWLCMRKKKSIVIHNLKHCFPDKDPDWYMTTAEKHFRSLMILNIPLLYSPLAESIFPKYFSVSITNRELLQAHPDRGHIFLCYHSSAMSISTYFVFRSLLNYTDNKGILMRSTPFITLACRYLGSSSIQIISNKSIIPMVRLLKNKGNLLILPDHDVTQKTTALTEASFFNVPCSFPKNIAKVAIKTQAKVWGLSSKLTKPNHLEIIVKDIGITPLDDTQTFAQKYNHFVEEDIQDDVAQYYWVHRRFKSSSCPKASQYP